MLTVLIAEKEHIDAIKQDNKLFFEPFLENKELVFCAWNPGGQTLQEAVPGLQDVVGREKKWRGVIIQNNTPETTTNQNPFDVVDTQSVSALTMPPRQLHCETFMKDGQADGASYEQAVQAWEHQWETYFEQLTQAREQMYRSALTYPLQQLATWLCFRPEDYILTDVQEKQDVEDWAMQELHQEHTTEKPSVTLERLERTQYKVELRMKENLRREFTVNHRLNIAYPVEVQCIAIRTIENGFFDPEAYWNNRGDTSYATFADRNLYFDKMRFMVFDLLPKTHRNFRTDYIRFLATILIFASNPIPGSAMQSRRLYRLQVDHDDTPLCTLVTSYDQKLAATSDVIEREMEKIRGEVPAPLTDKAAEDMFCSPQDVAVLLDATCRPDQVFVDKDYGLFYDSPEDEFHKWNRDYQTSEKALAYIARQQARSIRRSVNQAQLSNEISDVNISRLTPFQIDDIRDYTDSAEDDMMASIPPDLNDVSRYTERLAAASEKVKKMIRRRMARKTTFILSLICLGLYMVCFLPFLLDNHGTPKTVTTALLLSGLMIGVLAGIMFVSLFYLRQALRNAVREYNNTAKEIMNEIQSSMDCFSKYLSAASNVRRGHAVQNYAHKNVDVYTKSLRIRKKHQEDIRRKRAYLAEEYKDYFGDRRCCDETMSRPYEYDFDHQTEYDYPAPFLAGDCRQIEFISGGNMVTVPSSYITRILVKMEEIYDK